jgi:hypothetical protein
VPLEFLFRGACLDAVDEQGAKFLVFRVENWSREKTGGVWPIEK